MTKVKKIWVSACVAVMLALASMPFAFAADDVNSTVEAALTTGIANAQSQLVGYIGIVVGSIIGIVLMVLVVKKAITLVKGFFNKA